MLVNSKNQPVKVSDKLNSKTHPTIFRNLHEKLEPSDKYAGGMFKINVRAKFYETNQ